MPRRAANSSTWVSYGRSYLITLGILFVALPVWIWRMQGHQSSEWLFSEWALFYGVATFGLVLLLVAFLASRNSVAKWFHAATGHEASLVVMIFAAPVHFVLKCFAGKR